MTTTHNGLVTTDLPLDSPPAKTFGFGRIAMFRNGGASFLGGLRYKDYTATTASEATTGELDLGTKAVIAQMFLQSPGLESIRVVAYDGGSGETPADAYDDLVTLSVENDFYSAHLTYAPAGGSPALTFVTDLADRLRTRKLGMLMVDYTGTDIYTGALGSSALDGLEAYENVLVAFCDTAPNTSCHALNALARWLAFNPDTGTANIMGPIRATPLVTPPTLAQLAQLNSNSANVVLPFDTAATFFASGVMMDGRQALQVYIRDWLKVRMNEDLRRLILDYATEGLVIPVNSVGLGIGLSALQARLDLAVALGKVELGQFVIRAVSADVSTGKLSYRVDAQNTTAATGFDVTGQVTRNPVI